MYVAWFSAGITSAVACKLIIDKLGADNVNVCFIETGNHEADTPRFIADCAKWYNKEIIILQSKFENVQDVIRAKKFINSPSGAPCTSELKKEVRRKYHNTHQPTAHVLGFEHDKHELKRAENFLKRHPETKAIFPLIEAQLSKNECAAILERNGIKLPNMYKLGYEHNNCVGCVKGGRGYWNKIRIDFPDVFKNFAELEREINAQCINGVFLDELNPEEGNPQKPIMPNCGIFCSFNFL
jgi:3'-phosphoadenosine 5'-phosphosulfate sulfotransferase (PAPS reductase)/FAD synthetase